MMLSKAVKSEPLKEKIRAKQIIITADTLVCCDNQYLGKPKDVEHAKQMLMFLSGKSHQVITSVGFLTNKKFDIISEITNVEFRKLTNDEIGYYIKIQSPMDKAGSYGIQDWIGEIGVKKINGSYTNVIGLPLSQVIEQIQFLTKK